MKPRLWVAGWLFIVILMAGALGYWVYKVDPFMHFHKPYTNEYFYVLDNERSQNDGITKHFDYDALITGTSMTENFKTSEMDAVFGCTSVKVPYSGGSYKEINDNIKNALKNNTNLKTIIRCLDTGMFFDYKDRMRFDLGEYPTYLYDDNPFNDVKYLLSRDVIWNRTYNMTMDAINHDDDFKPGITTFDEYARWQQWYTFGVDIVLPNGIPEFEKGEPVHISSEEKERIKANIEQNVTSVANEHPEVDFYYFFPPYSVTWWQTLISSGEIYKQLEAEQYIIELILESENIKLFSFNNRYDITTDLNNYSDDRHYGIWINSLMLKWMHEGKYQLNRDNYQEYLEDELNFYTSFDYMSVNQQEDYENDFYADALYNEELTDAKPVNIPLDDTGFELKGAAIEENQYDGEAGIKCVGCLQRGSDDECSIQDALSEGNYIGGSISVDISKAHRYLIFYGRKLSGYGQPTVMVFDEQGDLLAEMSASYLDIDGEWHQYILDVSNLSGTARIVFNGGYTDDSGDPNSAFVFSKICLY